MGTPTRPPKAPPFGDLVRSYERLIHRTARRWGVRPAEVDDCAQRVLDRFYRAIATRRLDVSKRAGIGRWLEKTTRSVARDFRRSRRAQDEVLTPNDVLDREVGSHNPEGRMAEAMDVHDIVDRILDKMPWEQREVFVMVDLEDTPMGEVLEELKIKSGTAYSRLAAARATFAREWEAMQKGGAVVAPLALFSVGELIAAEHTLPDVPPGFTDEMLRRLGDELGQDFLAPAGGTVGAGLGIAVVAAKASGITLTVWQIGLGVLLVGIAATVLTAALLPAGAAPAPPAAVSFQEVSPSAPTPPPTIDPTPPPPGVPAGVKSSAPPLPGVQTRLLANARELLKDHQPAKALSLLARVTAPDLAEERDELRLLALGRLQDGGQP